MIERITTKANRCTCELRCLPDRKNYQWLSLAKKAPIACPNCKSKSWNGLKKVGRPNSLKDTSTKALPKPRRVRDV